MAAVVVGQGLNFSSGLSAGPYVCRPVSAWRRRVLSVPSS